MLALAALLFSTGGAAIKATAFNAAQTAMLRSGVAALALVIALPEARRRWSVRTLLTGLAYAATLALFVHATKLTTSANAVFLQSTAPLYLLAFGPLLLQEKLRSFDGWMGFLVAAGMALFFVGRGAAQATAQDPAAGNLLAVASGLTWALTLMGLRAMARGGSNDALPVVVAGNVFVFLFSMPAALPIAAASVRDVAVIVYLGSVQIGLAYVLLTRAMRHVRVFEASLILLLEPVSNPIWSWLLHHERMSAGELGGAALICAGVALQAYGAGRKTPA
jgi:drug/metabolite transporter (DMT)-like permease